MAVRRMYVHVGCPKTGTSYLQSICWASRDALRSQGIELPLDKASQFHLMLGVTDLLDASMDPPQAFDAVERFAAALPGIRGNGLVTQESLCRATPEHAGRLLGLLGDFEVHIVVTARDLARQLPSVWQQRLKQRLQLTFEDFCRAVAERSLPDDEFWAHQDLVDITNRWGATLPPQRVHVVTVPPRGAPPHLLLERFCRVVGCDPAELDQAAGASNPSLGAEQAEVLRRLNSVLGDRLTQPRGDYRQVVKRYLVRHVLAEASGAPLALPPSARAWCVDASEQVAARLADAGYDVVGDLADLIPRADDGETGAAADQVGERAVADVAIGALAVLLDQRYQDLERLDAQRQRIATQRARLQRRAVD